MENLLPMRSTLIYESLRASRSADEVTIFSEALLRATTEEQEAADLGCDDIASDMQPSTAREKRSV